MVNLVRMRTAVAQHIATWGVVSLMLSLIPAKQRMALANASGSVPAGSKPTPDPSPYERRISLPPLSLLLPDQDRSFLFEPTRYRLSFVCLLGTWNRQSVLVHEFFKKNKEFFTQRKIAAVAAFSHDTHESLKKWSELNGPNYLAGLASTEFVDRLNNPKVPTCWLLSRDAQLLRKMELPSSSDLSSVYVNLKQWTEF
ncbi:MAG: hypothetical protein RIR26_1836 [Pseudomonadota bacterium]|jgi:hypothetical protein